MKYFTHDLLNRFGSDNERIADAASEEWDLACAAYKRRLEEIRADLSVEAQTLLAGFSLHDAAVVAIWRGDGPEPTLSVLLRFDASTDKEIQITYSLVGEPRVIEHPVAAGDENVPLEWLYDELDVRRDGEKQIIIHSILLTGGLELQVEFTDLFWRDCREFVSQAKRSRGRAASLATC